MDSMDKMDGMDKKEESGRSGRKQIGCAAAYVAKGGSTRADVARRGLGMAGVA